jgi:hypothetical protein
MDMQITEATYCHLERLSSLAGCGKRQYGQENSLDSASALGGAGKSCLPGMKRVLEDALDLGLFVGVGGMKSAGSSVAADDCFVLTVMTVRSSRAFKRSGISLAGVLGTGACVMLASGLTNGKSMMREAATRFAWCTR